MRVLIVSQYYFPEAVPKPHELAEELLAKNHEVSVITGFPHYPGGKLKNGYKLGLIKREIINRIPIVRTFEFPYHGTKSLLRIANYLSFLLSAPLGAFFTKRCDVIYVWHPPLTVGVAAWLIAKIKRIPFVYDVQDIWPDTVVWSGMMNEQGLQVKIMRRLEKFVYRRAAHLIVQTAAGRENLIGKGVDAGKITVLQNWIDEALFAREFEFERNNLRLNYGWQNEFVVLFAGNLGLLQGLDTVIEAAKHFSDGDNLKIVFVGEGTDRARLEKLAQDLAVGDRVQFLERQPLEKMPEIMAAADVLLVHLKKSEVANYVVPSKTLAYLASGKPILMATGGASEELICAANAGVAIEPENPAEMAAAIKRLRQMPELERAQMGANGRKYLDENLSKQKLIRAYEDLLKTIAEETKR